jgi:hypothetical protein
MPTPNNLQKLLKGRMSQAELLRQLDAQIDPLGAKYEKFSQSRLNHYFKNNRQPDPDTQKRIMSAIAVGSKGPRLALKSVFPGMRQ